MARARTGRARVELLLPWINDGTLPVGATRRVLTQFVQSFDGTEGAGYVEVVKGHELPDFLAEYSTPLYTRGLDESADENVAFELLHERVTDVLDGGLQVNGEPVWLQGESRSLMFGVRGMRKREKASLLPRSERLLYDAAGAYVMLVDGQLDELVPFLLAHLLTLPGMVAAVTTCEALAPGWRGRCGKFLLTGGRGRPRAYCSDACKARATDERTTRADLGLDTEAKFQAWLRSQEHRQRRSRKRLPKGGR